MTKKGSGAYGKSTYSAPKAVAKIASVSHAPMKATTMITCKGAKFGGGGEGSYESKSKISVGDKSTGSYGRVTTKEKMSGGAFQYKNGTSGVKGEYKKSSTVRVGDKHGYTEVYKEERYRNVSYDNKSSGGSGNLISYGDSGSGSGSEYLRMKNVDRYSGYSAPTVLGHSYHVPMKTTGQNSYSYGSCESDEYADDSDSDSDSGDCGGSGVGYDSESDGYDYNDFDSDDCGYGGSDLGYDSDSD